MFERLPTPYGLLRAGVAPDHQHTKAIADLFDTALSHPGCGATSTSRRCDLTHQELLAHHHAVIYAAGASTSRDLGSPGEGLPGSHAAAEFVGWYNGHPDHADAVFDLSGQRAVINGNGNVALDVARILLAEPEDLALTPKQHRPARVDTLATSTIREVVILARRGPRDAAFSVGEFMAFGNLDGIDVVIGSGDLPDLPGDDVETAPKLEIAREFADRTRTSTHKGIVFRFLAVPFVGDGRVEGLRVRGQDDETVLIETSLVLRSIGYRSAPIPGVPFDADNGRLPNDNGRVLNQDGRPLPGSYVTG